MDAVGAVTTVAEGMSVMAVEETALSASELLTETERTAANVDCVRRDVTKILSGNQGDMVSSLVRGVISFSMGEERYVTLPGSEGGWHSKALADPQNGEHDGN